MLCLSGRPISSQSSTVSKHVCRLNSTRPTPGPRLVSNLDGIFIPSLEDIQKNQHGPSRLPNLRSLNAKLSASSLTDRLVKNLASSTNEPLAVDPTIAKRRADRLARETKGIQHGGKNSINTKSENIKKQPDLQISLQKAGQPSIRSKPSLREDPTATMRKARRLAREAEILEVVTSNPANAKVQKRTPKPKEATNRSTNRESAYSARTKRRAAKTMPAVQYTETLDPNDEEIGDIDEPQIIPSFSFDILPQTSMPPPITTRLVTIGLQSSNSTEWIKRTFGGHYPHYNIEGQSLGPVSQSQFILSRRRDVSTNQRELAIEIVQTSVQNSSMVAQV